MPKTLADGRIRLVALQTAPADPAAPTVTELNAGKELASRILKSDYQLGATGSQTITEVELNKRGEGQAFGLSVYSGQVSPFRYLDQSGKADTEEDYAWELLKEKGTLLYLVEREGPLAGAPWAEGDEVSVYEVTTDDPQKPSDRYSGYIKRTVPLAVGAAWENVTVVAGS